MTRMLIIEDDVPAAELLVHRLESAGLHFDWERVESEGAFRDALARAPDVILSDSEVPGFSGMTALAIAKKECPRAPFIFVTSHYEDDVGQRALKQGASGYVGKADVARLTTTVQDVLKTRQSARRLRDQRKLGPGADTSGIADYLLERRDVLDRTLRQQDRSAMSSIMRRTPPAPAALVMLESLPVRERFGKLLRNANIDIHEVESVGAALERLERQTHAVMFTDRIDLVRGARQLHAGAATHIVFVGSVEDTDGREAWRAGANDCMPAEPQGEEFWAHLTTARRIVSLAASLQLALSDNRILSTVDELTGCGSRRFFEQEFPREVERATRLGRPLSLVMADIDHFKQVNDRHGHRTGDQVLSEFGRRLSHGLRLGQDWLARVGGEEFAIVLPETSHEETLSIAERLRDRVGATPFVTASGPVRITASFGVCGLCRVRKNGGRIPEALISAADTALYASKGTGRNRVTGFAVSAP
jgi:two-component system cell cycle response regulator